MATHPKQKLKPGQEPFAVFMTNVSHANEKKANDIYYKGKKLLKYIAWRKFLTYFRMIQDPNIKLVTVENKPLQSKRHGTN